MIMKTRLILSIAVGMLAGQFMMNAQPQPPVEGQKEKPSFEEMAQRRADRMAMELMLDDKTADQFKTTYKSYLADKRALHTPKADKGKKKAAYRSDANVEKQILDGFALKQKKLDLEQDYYKKFRKFMGPKQIQKMYRLDVPKHRHHPQNGKPCVHKGQAKPPVHHCK